MAKAARREFHEDKKQAEIDAHREFLKELVEFLDDDQAFVYSVWPRRYELKDAAEELLWGEERA